VVSVAIVGAGFGGIGLTVRLRQAGFTDLTVYERSHDVGGVWRDNTYPGAACDVPSHLYSFSFDPAGRWSKRYAVRDEIQAYLRRIARDHGVLPHVRFGSEVVRCAWEDGRWTVTLVDGTQHVHDVVVTACGQLSRPAVPPLPFEQFDGPVFHSAEWDHDVDLAGKRVVVVGTGASAIQFVPEVAKVAAHVTVLQRSAPFVLPKPDRDYGERTRQLLDEHPVLLKADRLRTFVTHELRSLGFNTDPRLLKGHEKRWHRFLQQQVPDPALRARLLPDYHMGCKRILQSNDWYAALTRPNVEVVPSAVARVLPHAVETADGVQRAADVVILGTGFATTDLLAPMAVQGPSGTLAEAWRDGAEGYLGTAVAGFPNFFLLYGPNTNLGHNSIILMLESQIRWVVQAVAEVGRRGTVEVRADVQRRYNAWLQKRLAGTVFAEGCRSWYLTPDGRNTQNWPGTTLAYRLRTRRLDPADLVAPAPAEVTA
jgi:cation diffusion facilitator CzcD-associated flavoprotein CzcO